MSITEARRSGIEGASDEVQAMGLNATHITAKMAPNFRHTIHDSLQLSHPFEP
jgi:hypothetical protein